MRPLKVTAHMTDGRIFTYDGLLNLDSFLAWSWMWENHPDVIQNSNPLKDEIIEADLPLEKRGEGEDWYWACSIGQHEVLKEQISYWHKRVDAHLAEEYVDFGTRKGKIQTKSGTYKAYRMPVTEKLIPEITWYCVGDKAEIENLLSRVTAIGKKTAQGFGQVAKWVVEETDEDWSVMKEGKLMRPIPAAEGMKKKIEGRMAQMGIRPPYWHPVTQRVVVF